jgi:hypothetical protein
MLGLFKPDPYEDAALGRLERRKGHWRGRISLPGVGAVDLAIIGGRSGPDTDCLASVRDIARRYERLLPEIATALAAEHRQNGLDESEGGGSPDSSSIWDKVRTLGVLADRWAGIPPGSSAQVPVVVVEYKTEWDVEHTLGAVISGDTLIELNGSVLSVF